MYSDLTVEYLILYTHTYRCVYRYKDSPLNYKTELYRDIFVALLLNC